MNNERSRIDEIMHRMPADMRVVAQTIRTCAVWEFSRRWPEAADDMAAVVCGRWLHATRMTETGMAGYDFSGIDRLVNDSFSTLDDEQIAATERMFEELSRTWSDEYPGSK